MSLFPETDQLLRSVFPEDEPLTTLSLQYSLGLILPPQDCLEVNERFWVAQIGKQVVGILGLYSYHSESINTLWIDWFAVSPAFRRQGIGSRLFAYVEGIARQEGKTHLRVISVSSDKEAQKFYAHAGFFCAENTEPFIAVTGERKWKEDKILYWEKQIGDI
jgi:GNAT superfamily N-acetyltransferase